MPNFSALPAVDKLLSHTAITPWVARFGAVLVRNELRRIQTLARQAAQENDVLPAWSTEPDAYAEKVRATLISHAYTPVYNLTGTIIHTNLGRSLLSRALWREIEDIVTRPTNLEYDLSEGKRGDRDFIVEEKLKALTGCEAATIVNNNAAALLLVLNTFALGRKVPVSRGELIEIGGSFRLPELMTRSGCELIEVGTTNRTHEKDYRAALDDAAMILKVHPSNYHIAGFTKEVDAAALADMAREAGIPSCVDLGAGSLVDLSRWDLPYEPTPQSVLEKGIDVVTFSGDKLLGGVQAGLIVGKQELLKQIKSNPLKRALRADKTTLAALSVVLRYYEDPEHLIDKIPLFKTLTLDSDTLQARGKKLADAFAGDYDCRIEPSEGQIGSGALPDKGFASMALTLTHKSLNTNQIVTKLRELPIPVIGRIAQDKVWLDLRGADPLPELIVMIKDKL